ncbi:pentatricopeptide repeat-containing protein at1g62670 mitochondrial [Phtheirospermum japonicum]|uniref:Pentatricopeptide repeat-containing protein at1g62670 mitochondrial n=1 Tax=Phtheirospermum japonicum TaxID=374723 RepID=A0A830BSU3_9LAMI|nr:pentatricopeptide repeat-containing protein at1g62670 mitochondrial [Phtheirospermum japonicum]
MSRMRPLPGVIQFTQLLSRVVNFKEYSAAIHLFKDISCNLGIPVDEYAMTIAVNCYCLSNRVDYGFSILGWFFKRGCVPNAITFCTLLKGLFRENKINEAQALFKKVVREGLCEVDVITYGIVTDGLCKAGNTAMAIELLRVMEKGRRSCKPNTHVYNMVIAGLCKDRMIDDALKLFDEMSEKGITPDVVTYNALICGFCNLSRWREGGLGGWAKDVLQIMMLQNVNPNVISYNSLIDGYCLRGRMDEARNVIASMGSKNIAPDIWSYSILINGYCRKKKIDDAIHLFREMPSKGLSPNIVTYSALLEGLFCVGRCSCALELFDELQTVGLKPNFHTFCNLLNGLCKNGRVKEASLLLDALEHREGECLHITYYSIVMDGFCKAKNLDAARAIFMGLSSKGLEPDVVTYNILIKGCCKNGLLEEAQDVLLRMEEASLSPDRITYNSIVLGNLKRGQYEDAAKFLEDMDDRGFSLNASTFELLRGLLGTTEQNPSIVKMIQKLAPNTLNQKSRVNELGY